MFLSRNGGRRQKRQVYETFLRAWISSFRIAGAVKQHLAHIKQRVPSGSGNRIIKIQTKLIKEN